MHLCRRFYRCVSANLICHGLINVTSWKCLCAAITTIFRWSDVIGALLIAGMTCSIDVRAAYSSGMEDACRTGNITALATAQGLPPQVEAQLAAVLNWANSSNHTNRNTSSRAPCTVPSPEQCALYEECWPTEERAVPFPGKSTLTTSLLLYSLLMYPLMLLLYPLLFCPLQLCPLPLCPHL